jgi:hypothetical protein
LLKLAAAEIYKGFQVVLTGDSTDLAILFQTSQTNLLNALDFPQELTYPKSQDATTTMF